MSPHSWDPTRARRPPPALLLTSRHVRAWRCVPRARRSSDRHRGQRPRNSHRHPRAWRCVPQGIGTPVFRPASRPKARNAGLQTGIAAKGRETPVAMSPHSWDPTRARRSPPPALLLTSRHVRAWRCVPQGHRSAGLRPRPPHRAPPSRAGESPGRFTRNALWTRRRAPSMRPCSKKAATSRCGSRGEVRERRAQRQLGTPVFRPASRPQAAKLPSPCPRVALRTTGHRNAGLQTGIAAAGRETPIAMSARGAAYHRA